MTKDAPQKRRRQVQTATMTDRLVLTYVCRVSAVEISDIRSGIEVFSVLDHVKSSIFLQFTKGRLHIILKKSDLFCFVPSGWQKYYIFEEHNRTK